MGEFFSFHVPLQDVFYQPPCQSLKRRILFSGFEFNTLKLIAFITSVYKTEASILVVAKSVYCQSFLLSYLEL